MLLAKAKEGSQPYERPLKLLEDALKSPNKPRLGAYFFIQLGDALSRNKQHARAEDIFKVVELPTTFFHEKQILNSYEFFNLVSDCFEKTLPAFSNK